MNQEVGEVALGKALNLGLRKVLESNEKAIILGEDVGALGGVFRITDLLQKEFGEHRVMDTPLAESGIIGTAVGLALRGYRPICEIQFDGFVYPAYDQIINQVAKMRYRSAGHVKLPLVVRIPYGGGIGAVEHHSEDPTMSFALIPGLKVVTPANASDAYWMIQQAARSNDPIIFLEPKRRYWEKGRVDPQPLHPLHAARVVRDGRDGILLGYGPTVRVCLEAAEAGKEDGLELGVVDLRSLSPLDTSTIEQAVKQHGGKAVVVHEAARTGGLGAELAAHIQETCFYHLEAPVLRVTGYDIPYPAAKLEEEYLPSIDRVLEAAEALQKY